MIKFKYYRDKKGKRYYIPITIKFKKEIAKLQKVLDKNKSKQLYQIQYYIGSHIL